MTLALAYGGMATSGWDSRMWKSGHGDEIAHHVIDPTTGTSAVTDIARITVVAPTCMDAEVWTKALFLVGSRAAAAEANERGLTAIIVRADGACIKTGALA
jgi:thiamine biosynthesis lipoprotein